MTHTRSQDYPRWISARKALARKPALGFVAAFDWSFQALVRHFHARPTTHRYGSGPGTVSRFFLELADGRIASLTSERSMMRGASLYLVIDDSNGVDWEDYEQVMNSLGVPLEEVFRQGGLVWKRRGSAKPTS